MTNPTNWLSPLIMHSLGWALVHSLWQGTALAALAAAAIALCRRASTRYAVGVVMLSLMLAAPVATFFFLGRSVSTNPKILAASAAPLHPAEGTLTAASASTQPFSSIVSADNSAWLIDNWLVELWLIGVAFFSLRSAGAFFLLERQQRRRTIPVRGKLLDMCLVLQQSLGLKGVIRFCECTWLRAPAVIGWFRPVVLLPVTALTGLSPRQLESVIAHELAHIKRLDAFVNVFQICVETLLFYHPAVWWLNKRIRAEREHCCDDMAIELCGNAVEYARALTLMEEWRSAPLLAMAVNRGPLSERIIRLLGLKQVRKTTHRVGLAGSLLCLAAALIAGNALLRIARPKPTAYASSIDADTRPLGLSTTEVMAQALPAPQAKATPAAKPSSSPTLQASESDTPEHSYIDALRSAGLKDLMVDDLVALKIQGVTPDYVREMKTLGLAPGADGFVAMKVQGVTPEYVKELRTLGFNPDENQIVALKVQGVSGDYVRGLKEAEIEGDANQFIALKVQGVTPSYVRDLRAAGLAIDIENVIAMKVQGVTAEYVKLLSEQGLRPSADDIVGMRVQGVTPEYVRDIRALGLKPSEGQIIALRVQGVTPDYMKALRSSGLQDFKDDPDHYIAAKVQGITAEFIAQAQKHGFKDLDLNKLIQLKQLGILETKGGL
jgi:beta-lactamase regulating signal transducer with metallopeptidase domain